MAVFSGSKQTLPEPDDGRMEENNQKIKAKKTNYLKITVYHFALILIVFSVLLTKVNISNGNYNRAVALYNLGQYREAIAAFEAMNGYKDSTERISEIIHSNEFFKTLNVGDFLLFGNYGNEEIEWRVLDKQDNKLLVISEKGLDAKPYNEEWVNTTWEQCTLRKWLNSDFLAEAFTSDEQAMIQTTKVAAGENPAYGTYPGIDTEDKVFLLSIDEANQYFDSVDDRICYPTDYAVSKECWINDSGSCQWWLRSPGAGSAGAAGVGYEGDVFKYGDYVILSYYAVRPAMWINVE